MALINEEEVNKYVTTSFLFKTVFAPPPYVFYGWPLTDERGCSIQKNSERQNSKMIVFTLRSGR